MSILNASKCFTYTRKHFIPARAIITFKNTFIIALFSYFSLVLPHLIFSRHDKISSFFMLFFVRKFRSAILMSNMCDQMDNVITQTIYKSKWCLNVRILHEYTAKTKNEQHVCFFFDFPLYRQMSNCSRLYRCERREKGERRKSDILVS